MKWVLTSRGPVGHSSPSEGNEWESLDTEERASDWVSGSDLRVEPWSEGGGHPVFLEFDPGVQEVELLVHLR